MSDELFPSGMWNLSITLLLPAGVDREALAADAAARLATKETVWREVQVSQLGGWLTVDVTVVVTGWHGITAAFTDLLEDAGLERAHVFTMLVQRWTDEEGRLLDDDA